MKVDSGKRIHQRGMSYSGETGEAAAGVMLSGPLVYSRCAEDENEPFSRTEKLLCF